MAVLLKLNARKPKMVVLGDENANCSYWHWWRNDSSYISWISPAHHTPGREEFKDLLQNSCQSINKSMFSHLFDSRNISFRGLLSVMCSFLSGGYRCYLATLVQRWIFLSPHDMAKPSKVLLVYLLNNGQQVFISSVEVGTINTSKCCLSIMYVYSIL